MSYGTFELSVESGEPVEIYDIVVGGTLHRFTSATNTVTYGGHDYTPLPIVRDTILLSSEDRAQVISVTVPATNAFAAAYSTTVPGVRASMTIRRAHFNDGDAQLITLFKGVVRSVSFSDKAGLAKIAVMPLSGALARTLPRFVYSSLCNNVLFDSWCTKVASDYQVTGAVSNIVLTSKFDVAGLSAKGDGWATGGFATFDGDYRLIIKQVGDQVQLLLPFNEDLTGQTIDVFAGCDHTINTCQAKFSNAINFNGFPFVPTKNPFTTGIK